MTSHYYKNTTQVPNSILDHWIKILTRSELVILLIIIRQTIGWVNGYNGKRKLKDRISQSQFVLKSGLTGRMISKTLNSLLEKQLIAVYDRYNNQLRTSLERKGKAFLYYSLNPIQFLKSNKIESNIKVSVVSSIDNAVRSIGEILSDNSYRVFDSS